jgi:hypothetical protein
MSATALNKCEYDAQQLDLNLSRLGDRYPESVVEVERAF